MGRKNSLWPSRHQWERWSLVSRLTFIGALTGILGLLVTVAIRLIDSYDGDSRQAPAFPTVGAMPSRPVVKERRIDLLNAPEGAIIAHLYRNAELELRERAGSFREVCVYGWVFTDKLQEARRGTTAVAKPAYVWHNPFGWHEIFGLKREASNFRLAKLVAGAKIDVIAVEDPEVSVRQIRLTGWLPASAIGGTPEFNMRLQGDLREWLTDGKTGFMVSDVTWSEGVKVYYQIENHQADSVSVSEVRVRLFDDFNHVLRSQLRSLERRDLEDIAHGAVRLFEVDCDGYPFLPTGIEVTIYWGGGLTSGPYIATWRESDIEGTDVD